MTMETDRCMRCGIDLEADREIRSFYAMARDDDGAIRGMTVNVNRVNGCRHRYWIDKTWPSESVALADLTTWNEVSR